jgi:hypothetical protein
LKRGGAILKYKNHLIIFSTILFLSFNVQLINADTGYSQTVPRWVKHNAEWWAESKISDDDFINGMRFLIESRILPTTDMTGEGTNHQIPDSIKRMADAWSDNKISDYEFLLGIEYLIKNGVIELHTEFISKVTREMLIQTSVVNDTKKPVVIVPIFTAAAYENPGFYTYYRGQCNINCLTTIINTDEPLGYTASQNAINILRSLGYDIITDIDVDKNPSILSKYNKVIVLHNEYVTQKEFGAITNHPHVIYLYPNSLYAKVDVNYDQHTITLLRGHNYPDPKITNGFDWKFDNSPLEYNTSCDGWNFTAIKNGIMLNCYPENHFSNNMPLLKAIKDY